MEGCGESGKNGTKVVDFLALRGSFGVNSNRSQVERRKAETLLPTGNHIKRVPCRSKLAGGAPGVPARLDGRGARRSIGQIQLRNFSGIMVPSQR